MNRDTLLLTFFGTDQSGRFTVMMKNRGDMYKFDVGSEYILESTRDMREIKITGTIDGSPSSQL